MFIESISSFVQSAEPTAVLRITCRVVSVAAVICALEILSIRKHFEAGGLYDPRIVRERWCFALRSRERLSSLILSGATIKYVATAQLFAGLGVALAPPSSPVLPISCAIVSAAYLLLSLRGFDGFNGGDAMAKVVFLVATMAWTIGTDRAASAALYFVTAQLCVAYATPSILRAFNPDWWSGAHIRSIMCLETFGRRSLARVFSATPVLGRVAAVAVFLFEAGFTPALFASPRVACAWLFVGAAFHSLNAAIMGLNIFPWSFIGAYPAAVWSAQNIREVWWGP